MPCVTNTLVDTRNNIRTVPWCGRAHGQRDQRNEQRYHMRTLPLSKWNGPCEGPAPVADSLNAPVGFNSWAVVRLAARAPHRTHKGQWRGQFARLMPAKRNGKQTWVPTPFPDKIGYSELCLADTTRDWAEYSKYRSVAWMMSSAHEQHEHRF